MGDYKHGKRKGKGTFYYNNGDRGISNYNDDMPKGKFVILTLNGEVKVKNY